MFIFFSAKEVAHGQNKIQRKKKKKDCYLLLLYLDKTTLLQNMTRMSTESDVSGDAVKDLQVYENGKEMRKEGKVTLTAMVAVNRYRRER